MSATLYPDAPRSNRDAPWWQYALANFAFAISVTLLLSNSWKDSFLMNFTIPKPKIAARRAIGALLIGGFGSAMFMAAFPKQAAAVIAQAITTSFKCSTSTACLTGANSQSGPGVSATSVNGIGLIARSTNSSAVSGTTTAPANQSGILGIDSGKSASNNGVSGTSTYGFGVNGLSRSGAGVIGQSLSGSGVAAFSNTGYGIQTQSNNNIAIVDFSGGTGIYSVAGGSGSAFQAVATSPAYLLTGTNSVTDQDEVSIDSNGNEILAGTLTQSGQPLVRTTTSTGNTVAAYSPRTSSPTLEDFGEAELVNGQASVALDPTFATAIDQRGKYMVFLSPQGDNAGLYVTLISSRGFAVRESRAGHSTLTFDYRIVAKPYDTNAARLVAMGRSSGLRRGRALLPIPTRH